MHFQENVEEAGDGSRTPPPQPGDGRGRGREMGPGRVQWTRRVDGEKYWPGVQEGGLV